MRAVRLPYLVNDMRRKKIELFLIVATLGLVSACSQEDIENSSLMDERDSTAFQTNENLRIEKAVSEQGEKIVKKIPQKLWGDLKEIWCQIDPAKKIVKGDGLYVDVSGQLDRSILGAGAGASFAIFDKRDDKFVQQSFGHLATRVKLPSIAPVSTDLTIGYIYGCQGDPQNYTGDFLSVNVAGYGLHYGVKDWWIYGVYRDIKKFASTAKMTKYPRNLDGFLNTYSHSIRNLSHAIETIGFLWPRDLQSDLDKHSTAKLPRPVPSLTRDELFSFRRVDLELLLDHFRQVDLPSYAEGEVDNFADLLETVIFKEIQIQKNAESFIEDLELVEWYAQNENSNPRIDAAVSRQLASSYAKISHEASRLARVTHPTNIYSISRVGGKRVDLIEKELNNFLVKMRGYGEGTDSHQAYQEKIRSVVAWARYVRKSLAMKYDAIKGLRLLAFEWMVQLENKGAIKYDQVVGDVPEKSYWTGCNALSATIYSSNNITGVAGAANVALKTLGENSLRVLGVVAKTPFSVLKVFNPLAWGQGIGGVARTFLSFAKTANTDIRMSRFWKIGKPKEFESENIASVTKGLRSVFGALQCENP